MKGAKCTKTGLRMVPLSAPILKSPMGQQKITYEPVQLNGNPINMLQERGYSIIETSTLAELAMYHHQTPYSPPKSTILQAIADQQLKSFRGLAYESINKYLQPSAASSKGHMV